VQREGVVSLLRTARKAGRRTRRERGVAARGAGPLGGLFILYLAMCLVAVGLAVRTRMNASQDAVAATSPGQPGTGTAGQIEGASRTLRDTVRRALDRFLSLFRARSGASSAAPDGSESDRFGSFGSRLLKAVLLAMGGLDPEDPRTFLRAELPGILGAQRDAALPSRSDSMSRGTPTADALSDTLSGTLSEYEEPTQDPPEAIPAVWGGAPTGEAGVAGSSSAASAQMSVPTSAQAVAEASAKPRTTGTQSASPAPSGPPATSAQPRSSNSTTPTRLAARSVSDTLVLRGSAPKVAVIHTHSSEAYRPTSGADYCWGKPDGVIKVGAALVEELSGKLGVSTVHSSAIHDYPSWTKSYSAAYDTMKSLIKSYPSIDAVLDIHRDSLPAGKSNLKTAIVDGEKVARVLFVITDDTSGLAHPNWRRNYEFALKLSAQLESMYPGVTRGVAIHKHARFNQHLHDKAIIAEIGGTGNTIEEANRAARLVARALARVI
jgi:stage II sporulation protein P